MLNFDNFPSHDAANQFAITVRDRFAQNTRVFDSQEKSNQVDPFPFVLTAPIVLVDRTDAPGIEQQVEALVEEYEGQFAGT